jgi:predicted glycogen debranching enzyme
MNYSQPSAFNPNSEDIVSQSLNNNMDALQPHHEVFPNDLENKLDLQHTEFFYNNFTGATCYGSLMGCNTRSYHGVFGVPRGEEQKIEVLLSAMDEEVVTGGEFIELGNHQYRGGIHPQGYNSISRITWGRGITWEFELPKAKIERTYWIHPVKDALVVRYRLLEGSGQLLRLRPKLSFKTAGSVRKYWGDANTNHLLIDGGIQFNPFEVKPVLNFYPQDHASFTREHIYYDEVEYLREAERGYDAIENIWSPGYFEVKLKEDVFFVVTDKEMPEKVRNQIVEDFLGTELNFRDDEELMKFSAAQFLRKYENTWYINAGYPWFGRWARDTFISMPGLTLSTGWVHLFEHIMDNLVAEQRDGLFPNNGIHSTVEYNSVDAPLWFVWAVQQYVLKTGKAQEAWERWGQAVKQVIECYRKGTAYNTHMGGDGLIYMEAPGKALTWMDAVIGDYAITPRAGSPVEINALWFNAVCFALEYSDRYDKSNWADDFRFIPDLTRNNFIHRFWHHEQGYLADVVKGDEVDWSLRPNQVFAVSMPCKMVTDAMADRILWKVRNHLLTPVGLRTLAATDPHYVAKYEGDVYSRDHAYHQGTVWPWLLGHYAEGLHRMDPAYALPQLKEIYEHLFAEFKNHGLGSISEIYDADKPHQARGTTAQAWSVSELIRIADMIAESDQSQELGE